MCKTLFAYFTLFFACVSSMVFAGCGDDTCCQAFDVSVGWRRDSLDWKTHGLHSHYIRGHAKSRIHFNDIDSYTLSANALWAGSQYYIRASAEYGHSENGRAREHFKIKSPYLYHPVSVETSEPIKRRSEVYDFDAAVGYPFTFCRCRLNIIPLVGFSWHRQHLRVKDDEHYSSSSSYSKESSSCSEPYIYYYYYPESTARSRSDSFSLSSSNPFRSSPLLIHSASPLLLTQTSRAN